MAAPETGGIAACHAAMIVALIALGWTYPMGRIYFFGIIAVAALLAYGHALVRPDDLTRVNLAFYQVNIAISLGLLVFGVADLLISAPV